LQNQISEIQLTLIAEITELKKRIGGLNEGDEVIWIKEASTIKPIVSIESNIKFLLSFTITIYK